MGVSVIAVEGWQNKERIEPPVVSGVRVGDTAVMRALRRVRRELFLAEELREEAYLERALPIGEGQRMPSPSLVARTLELLSLRPTDKLLEVGTGSGYSAAVAAELARSVHTVERNANLARTAGCFLGRLGYRNVHVRHGEGVEGWPEAGPFDAISVTVPAPSLIRPLLDQLTLGGRLVMAMGTSGVGDALLLVTRTPAGFVEKAIEGPAPTVAATHGLVSARPILAASRTCA